MIIINGNVSKAAETRMVTGKNGNKTMVTDFSVAENTGYGENETTIFYKVTLWRDRGANMAKYLTVGKPVYIVAQVIQASPYINKDGVPAASLEISRVVDLRLNGKKAIEEDAPAEPNNTPF